MKSIFKEIETLIQFALALAQFVGVFLVKPHMFDLYGHNTPFLAGDPGLYIMLIVSAASLILVFIFKQKKHFKIWLSAAVLSSLAFGYGLVRYNGNLEKMTFLVPNTANSEVVRVIKGNDYLHGIKENCALLQNGSKDVKEIDVIQQCASLMDWSEIDRIWPRSEIQGNTNTLLVNYYLCLFLGGVSLIAIVQTLKCYRSNT